MRRLGLTILPGVMLLAACGLVWPSHHDPARWTPLFAAATAGDLAAVRTALDRDPSAIRAREWGGATLLHDSVGHGEVEMARLLIERGAKVNASEDDGVRPLHLAAQTGSLPLLELLVSHGAHLNPVDRRRWTPLDRARRWHRDEAARWLQERGARPGPGGTG